MNTSQQYIQLLITIRLRKLHQEGFANVRFNDLERNFASYVFKRNKPKHLNILTDRILNISADEIIRYLSLDASVSVKKTSLGEILQGVINES
ncbi:MAG: hypothetical protein GX753_04740 [Erysipelothrix sp.]|nr:hypothetical protein [Erysipelothrix sp.]